MSKTKKLLSFIFVLLMMVVLVGCELPTPNNTSKNDRTITEAEQALETVANRTTFTTEELEVAKDEINFTKSYAGMTGVTFVWTSSNEKVIKITEPEDKDSYIGKVTRSTEEDVAVTITCEISVTYTKLADGTSKRGSVSKTLTFNFVVKKIDAVELTSIADAKKGEKGDSVTVEGVVVALLYANEINPEATENSVKGLIVNDGTSGIYVYNKADSFSFKIGDTVKVIGQLDTYYGSVQISGGSEGTALSVVASSNEQLSPKYDSNTSLSTIIANFKEELGPASSGYYPEILPATTGSAYNVYAKVVKEVGTYTNIYFEDPYTGARLKVYYKTGYEYVDGLTGTSMVEALSAFDGKYVNLPIIPYATDSTKEYCALLASGKITEAAAPTLTDEDMVDQTITKLEALAGSYVAGETVALFATDTTTGATVTYKADVENVIDLTTGKIAETATTQTVTLTATVIKGTSTKTTTIELKVKEQPKNDPVHTGTAEDPYTVSDAVILAGLLDGDKQQKSETQVYVIGTISNMSKNNYGISLDYGNATFDITDGTSTIEVFRIKYIGNEKFTSTDQLKEGDTVTILAYLQNYSGTLEITSGYVTKVETSSHTHVWDNGIVTTEPTCTTAGVKTFTCTECGKTKTEPVKATGHTEANAEGKCDNCGADLSSSTNKGTEANPFNVEEACTECDKLSAGAFSTEKYWVTGVIKEVSFYNSTYKSYTLIISDNLNSTTTLTIYSATLGENVIVPIVGATIHVSGYMTKFEKNGAITLELSGKTENYVTTVEYPTIHSIVASDTLKFTADKTEITNVLNAKTTLTDNTTFPVTATYGTKITYTSSNAEVLNIAADGTVTVVRPTDNDVEVTVTYTLTLNNETDTNTIKVVVKVQTQSGQAGEKVTYSLTKDNYKTMLSTNDDASLKLSATPTYFGFDNNSTPSKGAQIGSGNKPAGEISIKANYNDGVKTVKVNVSTANSGKSTVAITVGGVSLVCNGSTSITASTTSTEYTFEVADDSILTGDIVISINATAKAFYILSVEIN